MVDIRTSPSGPEIAVAAVPVTSDQVVNLSDVEGANVSDALNTLDEAPEENLGNTGAAMTIDYDNGRFYKLANIDQNTVITIDTPDDPQYLHLRLTNGGTFTLTFTNTIQWKDNSPYVASGTESDLIVLYWSSTVLLGSWGSFGT